MKVRRVKDDVVAVREEGGGDTWHGGKDNKGRGDGLWEGMIGMDGYGERKGRGIRQVIEQSYAHTELGEGGEKGGGMLYAREATFPSRSSSILPSLAILSLASISLEGSTNLRVEGLTRLPSQFHFPFVVFLVARRLHQLLNQKNPVMRAPRPTMAAITAPAIVPPLSFFLFGVSLEGQG